MADTTAKKYYDYVVMRIILYDAFLPPASPFEKPISRMTTKEKEDIYRSYVVVRPKSEDGDQQSRGIPTGSALDNKLRQFAGIYQANTEIDVVAELYYAEDTGGSSPRKTRIDFSARKDEVLNEMIMGLVYFDSAFQLDLKIPARDFNRFLTTEGDSELTLALTFRTQGRTGDLDVKNDFLRVKCPLGGHTSKLAKYIKKRFVSHSDKLSAARKKKKMEPSYWVFESREGDDDDEEHEIEDELDQGSLEYVGTFEIDGKKGQKPEGLEVNGELQILNKHEASIRYRARNNSDPVVSGEAGRLIRKKRYIANMFRYFKMYTSRVEEYAFTFCRPKHFEDVLNMAIANSPNPLYTALKAHQVCVRRGDKNQSEEEVWEEQAGKAVEAAQRLGVYIDEAPARPFRKPEEIHVREVILNACVDYAINKEIEEICSHPVFMARIDKRWQTRLRSFRRKSLESCSCTWPWVSSPWVSCWLQFVFYFLFLFLLVFVTIPSFTVYHIKWTEALSDQVFGEADTGPFDSIGDADSFYAWLTDNVIPEVIPGTLDEDLEPYSVLVCPVSVRQLRVEADPSMCPGTNLTCYPPLEGTNTRIITHGTWGNSTWVNPENPSYTLLGSAGQPLLVPDGGYTVTLGPTQDDAKLMVENLKNSNWIDDATRAVVVEFAMYGPAAEAYIIVQALIEFTYVGTVHPNKGLSIVSALSLQDGLGWTSLVLLICVIGYLIQEISEFYFEYLHQKEGRIEEYKLLKGREEADATLNISLTNQKNSEEDVGTAFILPAFWTTIKEHVVDVWNILDFLNSVFLLLFLLFKLLALTRVPTNRYTIPLEQLQEVSWFSGISSVFAAFGLICSWFRLLYFSMPLRRIGLLVIAVLRMGIDVLNFFILLLVIVVGFGTAFGVLLQGTLQAFTNNIGDLLVNSFLIALGSFDGDTSDQPFQASWPRAVARVLVIIYNFLCGTVIINMLIAMMGNTFNDLMEPESIAKKWALYNGDLLQHYELFNWLPPPLNLIEMPLRAIQAVRRRNTPEDAGDFSVFLGLDPTPYGGDDNDNKVELDDDISKSEVSSDDEGSTIPEDAIEEGAEENDDPPVAGNVVDADDERQRFAYKCVDCLCCFPSQFELESTVTYHELLDNDPDNKFQEGSVYWEKAVSYAKDKYQIFVDREDMKKDKRKLGGFDSDSESDSEGSDGDDDDDKKDDKKKDDDSSDNNKKGGGDKGGKTPRDQGKSPRDKGGKTPRGVDRPMIIKTLSVTPTTTTTTTTTLTTAITTPRTQKSKMDDLFESSDDKSESEDKKEDDKKKDDDKKESSKEDSKEDSNDNSKEGNKDDDNDKKDDDKENRDKKMDDLFGSDDD